MAERILKFELPMSGPASLAVPAGARPLSVGFQKDALMIWVAADLEYEGRQKMELQVVMTGRETPQPPGAWVCVGRATSLDGLFVVHVFWRPIIG